MKKIGWYVLATLMTFVFLFGAAFSMIGMALDWIGDQIMKLCHEVERRYWNYEADGYKYCGDGIYTKTYTAPEKPSMYDEREEFAQALLMESSDLMRCPHCIEVQKHRPLYHETYNCSKCYNLWVVPKPKLSDEERRRENIKLLFASLEADLEAEHNRLTNPTGTVADSPKLVACPQCIDHYLGGGIHGTINGNNALCTACHGFGYLSEANVPAGKAEPEWSTEHLGPECK